ncbi:MAG: hypothetical protein F6K58_28985 [Symploca sp. SIO2E9]|nr:hypothetical protein [Symploca sp. SIO2E9]
MKQIHQKVLTTLLSTFLLLILLSGSNIAFAQPVGSDGLDTAQTSFYNNQSDQTIKVDTLSNLGYEISVPFDFNDPPPGGLGDGVVQQIVFDFQQVESLIPGTDDLFTVTGSLSRDDEGKLVTEKLYGVVAGRLKPDTCPIEIEDTQIGLYKNTGLANKKAEDLDKQGYLVYVSINTELQKKAIDALKNLNCTSIDGLTKKVTVDFKKVFELLPPRLQQPARERPFVYFPQGDSIYLVNARKLY